ncbi:MAG: 50S ribosomal protein L11 methyltransferase [Albidovulum sp.]|nr:50S ribosomal protein L11 methyltransferase [Albidovulum sp.]MDE0307877.1 50S ribosomal protein L11 methyltransferase [Albidovulum sp.]MDE0533572.1 50S ribosomal protein L11 methyltransferase [Albidovulum sp.]
MVLQEMSDRWEVGAYFSASPDPAGLSLLSTCMDAEEFQLIEIRDVDWVGKYRSATKPVLAGRFTIRGNSEYIDSHSAERNSIVIDSSMAFGTGRHGSTKGCICALESLAHRGFEPKKVADIGCGSGILSISAAKIWPSSKIVASDLDPNSVEVAKSNLKYNRVERRVSVFECAGMNHDTHLLASPYDLLLANILLEPLLSIVPRASELLAFDARAVLSGIAANESSRLREACDSEGLAQTDEIDFEGWITLVFRKRVSG